ncbi:MAG TPA: glycosyltransferase family 2 protein, partial [Anaerolineales bacterium]
MTRRPSVEAIIVHHESPATLTRVLETLKQQDQALDGIVVVDNGSRDEFGHMQTAHPDVRWVRLPENTGLTHARNAGLAQVTSELVLVLDDDVYLTRGGLRLMLNAMETTGAAVVCPRILIHPADSLIQCDGASIHFAGMLTLNNRDALISETPPLPSDCGAFIGACILARRQLLTDLGGFDEDYFFYFEDLELSYRMRALGHRIWCAADAVALHDLGQGTPGLSFRGSGHYPARRAYLTLRHRWITMLLHFQVRTLLLLSPALALYDLAAFIACVGRGFGREWIGAVRSLLQDLPSLQARRRRWQARRTRGDGAILAGGSLPF